MAAASCVTRLVRPLAFAALAVAAGCSTASQAVNGAATAATASTQAVATAATATESATINFIDWIWPFAPQEGPAAQRAHMEEQAGAAHFRNEAFTAARDDLHVQHSEFESRRAHFVSSQFVASRARFRDGRALPTPGSILGPAANDPAQARALLAAAAARGAAAVVAQPVLAALLPAFGN